MVDLSYPLRAVLGNIQHAHNYLKNVESYHLGRIYTDGCNLGYTFIFEPIVKPAFDFFRNHKVPTTIVGSVFVLAYLAHRTRLVDPADHRGNPPEVDSDADEGTAVNGAGGEGERTSDSEGNEGKAAARPKRDGEPDHTKGAPESEEAKGEGTGAADKPADAAAKTHEGEVEEGEGGTDGDASKPPAGTPPATGNDRKETASGDTPEAPPAAATTAAPADGAAAQPPAGAAAP